MKSSSFPTWFHPLRFKRGAPLQAERPVSSGAPRPVSSVSSFYIPVTSEDDFQIVGNFTPSSPSGVKLYIRKHHRKWNVSCVETTETFDTNALNFYGPLQMLVQFTSANDNSCNVISLTKSNMHLSGLHKCWENKIMFK